MDILKDRWTELKTLVGQKWGKLSGEDLDYLSGNTEELAGILRQRYGYGRAQAEIEITNWLDENIKGDH